MSRGSQYQTCLGVPIADLIFPALNISVGTVLPQDMPTFMRRSPGQNARVR